MFTLITLIVALVAVLAVIVVTVIDWRSGNIGPFRLTSIIITIVVVILMPSTIMHAVNIFYHYQFRDKVEKVEVPLTTTVVREIMDQMLEKDIIISELRGMGLAVGCNVDVIQQPIAAEELCYSEHFNCYYLIAIRVVTPEWMKKLGREQVVVEVITSADSDGISSYLEEAN